MVRLGGPGVLVYSVCSTMSEEGKSQVDDFLNEHRDFFLDSPDEAVPKWSGCLKDGHVHLGPHPHGTDGFFAARMRRKEISS